jgi:lipopolysaccharide export system permease protein
MLILYRYILKSLTATLVFTIFALCLIFLVVNLLENLDKFIDKNVDYKVIILYYIYFFPEIIKILAPVGLLTAILFTVGKLSRDNEITAMKTGGVSIYRILYAFILFSFILSLGQLYFNGWIVPRSIEKKFAIEEEYLHKRISGGPIVNLYFRNDPTTNVIIQYYDSERKTGNRVSVEKYLSEKTPRLIERTECKKMFWDSAGAKWKMIDGIVRSFRNKIEMKKFDTLVSELNVSHENIIQLKRSPEEMNFDELRQYIDMMKHGGKDVRKQMIEYYSNYAFPFSHVIVVLFAVPFASVRRKGGLAIQIGAALVITFTYMVFTEVSQTIGYSANIEPILSGWGANLIFLLFGLYTIYKTRT